MKSHNCVAYLLDVINNYEQTNINLAEENVELKVKNKKKIEEFNEAIFAKEEELSEVESIKQELTNKNEKLKAKLENERRLCEQIFEKKTLKLNEGIARQLIKFLAISNEKCSELGENMKDNLQFFIKNVKTHLNDFNIRIAQETGNLFDMDVSPTNNGV